MAEATLSLGANLGQPRVAIAKALALLDERGARVVRRSSDYRTPPWGKTDQPAFVNAAAVVETALSPHALLHLCLAIERELGRVRIERWGPRLIDIDLITYDQRAVDDPELTVPHRHVLERGFVLVPLAEIAPDLVIEGRTVAEHARRFAAEPIEKLPPEEDA
jgi:2-amino-4-hydroxy-6-hydroxymethyldihydropteridine diphosphokinase